MPYSKISEANPAIRGIKPPVTVSQANMIAKWAEGEGLQKREKAGQIKSAWAVAIALFKRTHRVEGGKWVRKKGKEKTLDEMSLEEVKELEELGARMDALYHAFHEKFQRTVATEAVRAPSIIQVYDDHVIAKLDKKAFKVPYTMDDEGKVEFGEMEEGEFRFVKTKKEKAAKDVQGKGEKEKAHQSQKARAAKYGIAVLYPRYGHLNKPGEWENVPESQFGDPVNWRYPLHDRKHVANARGRYGQEDFSYKGKEKVGARIAKAAKKHKMGEYKEKGIATWCIKATEEAGQRIIEGYATLWNEEDFEGEVMEKSAIAGDNFDRYMLRPIVFWRHGRDPDVGLEPIGKVIKAAIDDVGLWVRVHIFQKAKAADKAWNFIRQGVKSFSVGAVQARVRKIGNRIVHWPLAEISVEPLSALAGATFEIVPSPEWAKALGLDSDDQEEKMAGEIDVKAIVAEAVGEVMTQLEATRKAEEEARATQEAHDAEIAKKAIEGYQEKLRNEGPVEVKAVFGEEARVVRRPLVASDVYSGATLPELCLAYAFVNAGGKTAPSEYLRKALAAKGKKALEAGELASKCIMSEKGLELDHQMALAVKTDEIMVSTGVTYGDEWVYTTWSREIWRKIREDVKILGWIREVEVEGETLTIPVEGTDPMIYKVGEVADLNDLCFSASGVVGNYDSKASTGQKTLSPQKIGGLVIWSGELAERSIVAMASMIQDQFQKGFNEKVEEILINGHTEVGATNISDYANASISTYWRILTLNGLRYYWLVAQTGANSRDGGVLSAEDFSATRKLMGTNGKLGLNPRNLKCVMDAGLYYKLLTLGEVLTQDKWMRGATIVSGELEKIFGSEVYPSGEYGATDSSGHIHTTVENNDMGSFFYFNPYGFLLGRGRQMDAEVQKVPWADAHYLVGFASFALACFDYELIAGSYNLSV